MSDQSAYPCPCCHIGFCQPGNKTYMRVHGDLLLCIPDMTMWTCDICQYQEFDPERVKHLDALLGDSHAENGRGSAKLNAAETNEPTPEPTHTLRRMKS
ncbi:MAG: hypothetical protein JNJ61_03435 [Anaerolineae bacterium]|nr:hypothetical protein [Anaerolineae bacterium]